MQGFVGLEDSKIPRQGFLWVSAQPAGHPRAIQSCLSFLPVLVAHLASLLASLDGWLLGQKVLVWSGKGRVLPSVLSGL